MAKTFDDKKIIYTMDRVSRAYGTKVVLKDISISYYYGAKIGVIGENGAGKSSLFKIFAGIDTDYTGETKLLPGYTMGYLDNFKIDSSGIITGVYSNGTNRTIGQIALASFANDRGLEKAGDNTYVESNNSGMARIGESGVAGKGTLMAGALEMSNVDLSAEFTDMITTQRGFQANSRIITTSDSLLEELVNLKR